MGGGERGTTPTAQPTHPPSDASHESITSFTARMRTLLELEHGAEKEESVGMLERTSERVAAGKGVVLLGMRIEEIEGGLMGKMLVTLMRNGRGVLPVHPLSQHDVVRVRVMGEKGAATASGQGGGEGVVRPKATNTP